MTELREQFATDGMNKLKNELSRLISSKDNKTVNTLLHRNPNTWKFNTRELNEEIPCEDRHFTKRKGVMKCETRARGVVYTSRFPRGMAPHASTRTS
ncbi:hypothetical protein M9Y10_043140 [Tritrichomonas musculus]|uniref:Uncharacterized protein n=1 Tax=Tritrichomonas musculus TaxID=1915356 RepID=A0ABR2JZA9_9EUKA